MNRKRLKKSPIFLISIFLFSFLPLSLAQGGPKALVNLNVNGSIDVGVLEVETKTLKNLTNTPNIHEFGLNWSPDGQKILFISGVEPETHKLEVLNANGTERRVLDFIKPGEVRGAGWSPSGERLALGFKRDDNVDIYTVRLDGSGLKRLTDHPADDTDPFWSPDGSRIAFLSNRKKDGQLYVMSASGGNLIQLTDDFDLSDASWSPDGTQFVLRGISQGNFGYFILDADGKGKLKPLVPPKIDGIGKPVWLPDGRILLHTVDGIFTIDVKKALGVVKGENLTLLWKGAWPNPLPLVQSWFDPAFAPKQAVHFQQKLPVILGRLKAAVLVK